MFAGVVAPDVFHLSPQMKEIIFFVCMAAAFVMILIGAIKEIRAEAKNRLKQGYQRRMIAVLGMLLCGLGFLVFAAIYFWPTNVENLSEAAKPQTQHTADNIDAALQVAVQAHGGRGGSGEIFGNNGTVIGGKGGNVGAGGRGIGGDGGSGVIHGDGGTIIGGEGGSVDGNNIWFPPAQSAFIQFLESQGQTPDFNVQYPGTGGASGGWLERQQIVVKIREEYFKDIGNEAKTSSKIEDVPLDYINKKLKELGQPWCVRIENKYWYLYYIP